MREIPRRQREQRGPRPGSVRRFLAWGAPALVTLVAACSPPTAPVDERLEVSEPDPGTTTAGSATPHLVVPQGVQVAEGPGFLGLDGVHVTDGKGHRLALPVQLHVLEDSPWVPGHPVIGGVRSKPLGVELSGYGRAVLEARADGGRLRARIEVEVASTTPRVVDVAEAGMPIVVPVAGGGGASRSTFRLWAYRAGEAEWGRLTVGGLVPTRISVLDSASVEVELDLTVLDSCRGTSIQTVETGDVASDGDLTVRLGFADELALAPGAPHRVPTGPTRCLRFAPEEGARYVAVMVDARAFDAYRTAPMPWSPDHWTRVGGRHTSTLTLASRPALAPPTSRSDALVAAGDPRGEMRSFPLAPPQGTYDDPSDRHHPPLSIAPPGGRSVTVPGGAGRVASDSRLTAAPPAVGDTVWTRAKVCTDGACSRWQDTEIRARVVRRWPGDVVLLVPADDRQDAWLQERLPRLDAWYGTGALARLTRLLEDVYGRTRPESAPGAGLHLLAGEGLAGAFAWGDAESCGIQLPAGGPTGIVAHEMTHCFQLARELGALDTQWGLEGGAEVLAWQFVRREAGQALDANTPQARFGDLDQGGVAFGSPFPALIAATTAAGHRPSMGVWSKGYGAAAALATDWFARLVLEGGFTETEALRAVVLGMQEQGYGAGIATGLVSRLSPLGFDPVEDLLATVMRWALDGDPDPGAARWQLPWVEVAPHLFQPRQGMAARLDGARESATGLTVTHSTYGIVELTDPGTGAVLHIDDPDGLYEWLVVRVR